MYLKFFEGKGHLRLPSFSLVPRNDKSVLLINAGMTPLKPYFTQQEIPPRHRVTTCQKCIRTGDIENVGHTDRHATYFEMLGNFSFGDYFKHEAIPWAWEFLTEVVGLEKDRLYPSVYKEDDEAYNIWKDDIGIAPDRIFKFGKEDNFWEHGAGPCGPCSEIYYDRGEKYGCGKPTCTVGCDCDRYMEVWNIVFTQFDADGKGNYDILETKNIDTGMGLERLASVVQDVDSIFDVDTIVALREKICDIAGKTYKENRKDDVSIRLITDHIRSVTFMVSDGIMPSNEGRGYVLRRLLRRAAAHGRMLGIPKRFMKELSETVIEISKGGYPELEDKRDFILNVIDQEEQNFEKTIDQGMSILDDIMEKGLENGILSGDDAFKLHDTYGFPLDLTREILSAKGIGVDEEGFRAAMERQKVMARESRKVTNYMGADATIYDELDVALTSEFTGYDKFEDSSVIEVMTTDTEVSEVLTEGVQGTIITAKTPFYAVSGGQSADTGFITKGDENVFEVSDVIKLKGDKIGHIGKVIKGEFTTGDTVDLKIDEARRLATTKNHSATHLLQKALRTVLGNHVEQKGSAVSADGLRFDFSHFAAMTPEEIRTAEDMVNKAIADDLKVTTEIMNIEEAKKSGAMALFDEKYGENVRIVTMGDFSKEFCGGCHVKNTGSIRLFKILSESGIASGVRRIEAVTDEGVLKYYRGIEDQLKDLSAMLRTEAPKLHDRISQMTAEIKELEAENRKLKTKLAGDAAGDIGSLIQKAGDTEYAVVRVENVDNKSLMELADNVKARFAGAGIAVIASVNDDGTVKLVAGANDAGVQSGIHAGNIIKEIAPLVGGKGGGRPNMAQAGGTDASGIDKVFAKVKELLEK
ncbi:MAG: alanine--tRNA ligase [Lachnospiraceae bacterium]|nr:alanine--tRNA ligase [Lachnospiraceae bacterium]